MGSTQNVKLGFEAGNHVGHMIMTKAPAPGYDAKITRRPILEIGSFLLEYATSRTHNGKKVSKKKLAGSLKEYKGDMKLQQFWPPRARTARGQTSLVSFKKSKFK